MPDQNNARGAGFPNSATQNTKKGKDYVLAIGIDAYTHQPVLHNCVRDVEVIASVLREHYGFAPENIHFLRNEAASRRAINQKLVEFANILQPEDNFIFLFSGHGSLDPQLKDKSYLLPYDCPTNKEEFPTEAVDTTQVTDRIKAMKARHIFLLIDSCFSGAIFSNHRAAANEITYAAEGHQSRWALTSGRVQLVSDGTKGQHSPFAAQVIRYLSEKNEQFSLTQMAFHIKQVTPRNSDQEPDCGPLRNVNDDGGVYILRPITAPDAPSSTAPIVFVESVQNPATKGTDILESSPASINAEKLAELRPKIIDLIRKGRLGEAFKLLNELLVGAGEDLQTEANMTQQRFAKLERDERLGLLSFAEAGIERQRITKAFLDMINDLD